MKKMLLVMAIIFLFTPVVSADYSITVNYLDPVNLDVQASRTIGRGIQINMTGNDDIIVYFLLTYADTDREIIDTTTRAVNATAYNYTVFNDKIMWNYSYLLFVGVLLDDDPEYTDTNFTLDCSNFSVINLVFSADDLEDGTGVQLDDSDALDFLGFYIYFEPGFYDQYYSFDEPGGTNLGTLIIEYGEWLTTETGINFDWFYLLIAFLIIAIFCFVPLGFALKYDFSLPNFMYGIFIICGSVINQAVGLFSLWMTILVVLVVIFAIVIRYRDNIEKTFGINLLPISHKTPKSSDEYKSKRMLNKIRGEE